MSVAEDLLKTLAFDFFSQKEISSARHSFDEQKSLILNHESIVDIVASMVVCTDINKIFKQNESSERSYSQKKQSHEKPYYNKWDDDFCCALSEIPNYEKEKLFNEKERILTGILKVKINEWLSQEKMNGRKEFAIEHSISKCIKPEINKNNPEFKSLAVASVKIISGICILLILGAAILMGITNKPEVSIEINLGEILAGLFGGIGAATAGLAYAYRKISPTNEIQIGKNG